MRGCRNIGRRLCTSHRNRQRTGDTRPVIHRPRGTPDDRFDRQWTTDPTTGCRLWTGYLWKGYGRFRLRTGKVVAAHRFAFERVHGPVPEGLVLDHRCHPIDGSCRGGPTCPHRRCVHPEHTEPTTRGDNTRRRVPHNTRRREPATQAPAVHDSAPVAATSSTPDELGDTEVINEPLLKAEDIAVATRSSVSWAYTLMRNGQLQVVKIGRRKFVRQSELHRFLAELPVIGEPAAAASQPADAA